MNRAYTGREEADCEGLLGEGGSCLAMHTHSAHLLILEKLLKLFLEHLLGLPLRKLLLIGQPDDHRDILDPNLHRLGAQTLPGDVDFKLADDTFPDRQRQPKRVERLGLEAYVAQHHLAIAHADAQLLWVDVGIWRHVLVHQLRGEPLEHL
eukprot:CAMPEP_0180249332 /NCGR_PEP_ID=MMETSP0987-20121128/37247_1 /TAXON_ID=697907 /ORGANISM="non described non described, Strain CCMP2293" /LENGTH=150 /DNA_ID=CAMNT_0022217599 /DNA_START=55 /DNA_END=503 /DNA_ORIENTATION=+